MQGWSQKKGCRICGKDIFTGTDSGESNQRRRPVPIKKYEMALDSYICALGRYDANYQKATDDSLKQELDRLAEKDHKAAE